ncbi:unnamed protein product [Phytomonas sp. EM1]|nr:unnamed protein product [Phytomonas sp. EM1]|eukprot:CCW65279.1 unnamed protein product [Phytomonas sp. isolate EM1]
MCANAVAAIMGNRLSSAMTTDKTAQYARNDVEYEDFTLRFYAISVQSRYGKHAQLEDKEEIERSGVQRWCDEASRFSIVSFGRLALSTLPLQDAILYANFSGCLNRSEVKTMV